MDKFKLEKKLNILNFLKLTLQNTYHMDKIKRYGRKGYQIIESK